MNKYFMKYFNRFNLLLIVLCLLQMPAYAEENNKAYQYKSLDKFWVTFRSAALNREYDIIARLTNFPVLIRGTFDDDPVIPLSQQSFIQIIEDIFSQPSGLSLTDMYETELELFKRTIKIKDESGTSRAGSFVFQLIENRWLLVRVYSDLPEIQ